MSVFRLGFEKNIERIYRSSASRYNSQDGELADTKKANFLEILNSLDRGIPRSRDNKGVEETANISLDRPSIGDRLSNFDLLEQALTKRIAEGPDSVKGRGSDNSLSVPVKNPPIKDNSEESSITKMKQGTEVGRAAVMSPVGLEPSLNVSLESQTLPESVSHSSIKAIITEASRSHGVDPALGIAVARMESNFETDALSQDGHFSKGVFQLIDQTAKEMRAKLNLQEEYSPFDAEQNSFLGTGYLRYLHDIFSVETVLSQKLTTTPAKTAIDLEKLAVAAFNAGEGRVANAQNLAARSGKSATDFEAIKKYLPISTQDYVRRVFEYRESLASGSMEFEKTQKG